MKRDRGREWGGLGPSKHKTLLQRCTLLLFWTFLFFFPPKGSCDLQPPDGFAGLHEPSPCVAPDPLSTEDEDNLAPGTCTPRPLQATCEPCKLQPQPTENPGHRQKPASGQRAVLVSPATRGVESKLPLAVVFLVASTAWEGQAGLHQPPAFP